MLAPRYERGGMFSADTGIKREPLSQQSQEVILAAESELQSFLATFGMPSLAQGLGIREPVVNYMQNRFVFKFAMTNPSARPVLSPTTRQLEGPNIEEELTSYFGARGNELGQASGIFSDKLTKEQQDSLRHPIEDTIEFLIEMYSFIKISRANNVPDTDTDIQNIMKNAHEEIKRFNYTYNEREQKLLPLMIIPVTEEAPATLVEDTTVPAQKPPILTLQRSILATTAAAVALFVGAQLWDAGMNKSETKDSPNRPSPEENSPKKKMLTPDGRILSSDLIAIAEDLLTQPLFETHDKSIRQILTEQKYLISDIRPVFPQKMKAGDEGLIVRRYPTTEPALTPSLSSAEKIDAGGEFTRIARVTSFDPNTGATDTFSLLIDPTYFDTQVATNLEQLPQAPNIVYSFDGTYVQQIMTRWVRDGQIDRQGVFHPFANPVEKTTKNPLHPIVRG